jgi:hypothetical protein
MNKGIIFFIGFLLGVLSCLLLYRFDKKMFNNASLYHENEATMTPIDTNNHFEASQKPQKQYVEEKNEKTVVVEDNEVEGTVNQISIYNSEFAFEGKEEEEGEEEVFSDQLLETRTVKVSLLFPEKIEGKLPDDFYHFFEIQQWSTFVKNQRTYYRNQNMVKIKGMNIDRVNVVFYIDTYFLEVGNRYYAIPEKENFEKLNVVTITK